MAKITIEIDDSLLGDAARALGTHGATETVHAALKAAARRDVTLPAPPRDPTPFGPPGPPDVPGPARPGPAQFPHPPEVH